MEDVAKLVWEIVRRECQLNGNIPDLNSNIYTNLNMDTLDLVYVLLEINKKFRIDIPEEEENKLRTLGDLVNIVSKYLKTEVK